MKSSEQGFTLLEVLVAGVLLFAAVATAAQVYRGALHAFSRAQDTTQIQAVVPLLLSQVQYHLDQGEQQGEGQFGPIIYRWQSEPGEQHYVTRSDVSEFGETPSSRFTQQLHQIRLELRRAEQSDWQREYRWQAYQWRLH